MLVPDPGKGSGHAGAQSSQPSRPLRSSPSRGSGSHARQQSRRSIVAAADGAAEAQGLGVAVGAGIVPTGSPTEVSVPPATLQKAGHSIPSHPLSHPSPIEGYLYVARYVSWITPSGLLGLSKGTNGECCPPFQALANSHLKCQAIRFVLGLWIQ